LDKKVHLYLGHLGQKSQAQLAAHRALWVVFKYW